jgi:hypothetical protein
MDYEKKHQEDLESAKGWLAIAKENDNKIAVQILENLFPELKESEDEKIRKGLIEHLKELKEQSVEGSHLKRPEHYDAWIAWLEKQSEQKPVDKIEPKFKIDDWITNGKYTWKVIYIKPLDYILRSQSGDVVDDTISYVDEEFHLWTIQDAKDGDVLADCFGNICIYQKPSTNTYYHTHCYGNHNYFIDVGGSHEVAGTYPATKEQCDFLFQKMEEAGYEWDAEKKELKKIEQKPATWSEEDERIYNEILDFFLGDIETRCATIDKQRHFGYWLKSIKSQPHWKPSEYDISLLEEIARNIRNNVRPFCSEVSSLEDLIKNLKTL